MSIETSDIFKSDTGNSRQNVVPLVVIYKNIRADAFEIIDSINDDDKLFLSTQNIYFDGNYYEPLLQNIPDVKETLDLETKKYRIQGSGLTISNVSFHGRKFSGYIKDIINCAVRIYWKSQSCKTLEDCSMINQGTITRFTQSKTAIKLSVEDISQLTLDKLIPELIPDDEEYAKQDRLTPFPMVYGHVTKSPLKKRIDNVFTTEDGVESVSALIVDTEPVSKIVSETRLTDYPSVVADKMPEQSAVYVKDGTNYINILNNVPQDYDPWFYFIEDISGQMFEIVGSDIIATPLYTQVQQEIFRVFGYEAPAMGRVLRKITQIKGHRKARSRQISTDSAGGGDSDNDGKGHKIGGQLFAVRDLTEDPWLNAEYGTVEGSMQRSVVRDETRYVPSRWYSNMWDIDNEYSRDAFMFPFDTDSTSTFTTNPSYDPDNMLWNGGADELDDEIFGKTIDWNSDNWGLIKPNDFKDAIKNDDKRGLGWYGRQESEVGDQGAYVYWEFTLEPLETNSKCITWFIADIWAYTGWNWELGSSYVNEYSMASALWGGENIPQHPNPAYHHGDYNNEHDFARVIHAFPSFLPNNKQHIRKEDGDYTLNAREFTHYGPTGTNFRNVWSFPEKTIIHQWNTPNQFKSVKLGMPQIVQTNDDSEYLGLCCGAINYMHIIQDVFVENTHEKTWYANVYGRLSEGVTNWSPFNSFLVETLPEWLEEDSVLSHIESLDYSQDGTGGNSGWLVNGGDTFSLDDFMQNMQIIPKRMWVIFFDGRKDIYNDGQFDYNYDVNNGDAFIVFTEDSHRILPTEALRRNFIRMHYLGGASGEWEEGFSPSSATDNIEAFYTNNGWDSTTYIPEVNVGGMVESPHGIVQHLLSSEVDYNPDYYDNQMLHLTQAIHQGWRMAFTLTEQMKLKDVIEEFATNTKMLPKFRADGTFTFNPMKSFYNMSDVRYKIYAPDVQKFSFELTKVDDVYDQVKLLYHYDYGNKEFSKLIEPAIRTQTGEYSSYWRLTNDLYQDTNPEWVYDMAETYQKTTEEGLIQIEAKYIRDEYTANEFKKYKLMESINQKLIVKLELSTKFLNLEAGDVVYINQLSDETAFGYKYWTYEVKGGQLVYPFFIVKEIKKKANKINVIAQQLHRLQYGLPLWYIEGYNNDEGFVPPLTEEEIGKLTDDGNVYNGDGEDVTYTYQSSYEEPPVEFSEYFNTQWENENNTCDWNQGSIRLNIYQTPYSFEYPNGMTWTAEIADVSDDNVGPYSQETDKFELTVVSGGDNTNHQGYCIIKAKHVNPFYPFNYGKIRIVTEEGNTIIHNFKQEYNIGGENEANGDVNFDGVVNMLDIVMMVQHMTGQMNYEEQWANSPDGWEDELGWFINAGDMNSDGGLNVLDILLVMDIIMGGGQ